MWIGDGSYSWRIWGLQLKPKVQKTVFKDQPDGFWVIMGLLWVLDEHCKMLSDNLLLNRKMINRRLLFLISLKTNNVPIFI